MIPLECAASSADAICWAMRSERRMGSRPWLRISCSSVRPSSSSRTRNGAPVSVRPMSVNSTMCGWPSVPTVRPSSRKRPTHSASSAYCWCRILIATSRPISVCSATYTEAMPPAAMRRISR